MVDKIVGGPIRYLMKLIVGAFVRANYLVMLSVDKKAYQIKDGAIVISNHQSFIDGPLILLLAWPFAWIRPTMWHVEYNRPGLKYFFMAIGAICLGSPKNIPTQERERRKHRALEVMDTLIKRAWGVLIFPEGSIGDGSPVKVPTHLVGTYDLIKRNPDKPIVMVTLRGLEQSRLGRGKIKCKLWKKLPIEVSVKVFGHVDISKGHEDLNQRLNAFWNEGKDL